MALTSISLGDQLAALLRERIIRGNLEPGTHLVEDSLATEHGVSRGPVRDALRCLNAEGLVRNTRRGAFVVGFTLRDIQELYAIRLAVESLALELAVQRADAVDWTKAQNLLEQMREAAERRESDVYAKADLDFHGTFYENSGNRRLLTLWDQYRPTFATMLEITNSQDTDLGPSFADHVALLESVREGVVEQACELLRSHLAGSERRMLDSIPC